MPRAGWHVAMLTALLDLTQPIHDKIAAHHRGTSGMGLAPREVVRGRQVVHHRARQDPAWTLRSKICTAGTCADAAIRTVTGGWIVFSQRRLATFQPKANHRAEFDRVVTLLQRSVLPPSRDRPAAVRPFGA